MHESLPILSLYIERKVAEFPKSKRSRKYAINQITLNYDSLIQNSR